MIELRGTTIVSVRKGNLVAIAGDGQVTLGNSIFKSKAKKIRRLYHNNVLVGFAGATADAFTLFEKLEKKLEEFSGNLTRASVELAKEWRTDKILRRLEALMIAADKEKTFILSGNGDVLSPDNDVCAIGSGGNYALSAARAMVAFTDLNAKAIASEALKIASDICIYTNDNISIDYLEK